MIAGDVHIAENSSLTSARSDIPVDVSITEFWNGISDDRSTSNCNQPSFLFPVIKQADDIHQVIPSRIMVHVVVTGSHSKRLKSKLLQDILCPGKTQR